MIDVIATAWRAAISIPLTWCGMWLLDVPVSTSDWQLIMHFMGLALLLLSGRGLLK